MATQLYGDSEEIRSLPREYKVLITSNNFQVVAAMPPEISFSIQAEWESAIDGSPPNMLEKGTQELLNKSTKTKMQTAIYWTGNSPIEMTIPISFFSESSSVNSLDPTIALAQMALPKGGGGSGANALLTPPGPRVFNGGGDRISVQLGRFMLLKNIVITSVSPTYSGRMTIDGYPIKSSVDISFKTQYSVTASDLKNMFMGARR